MSLASGDRDRVVTIQRATVTLDDHGGEVKAWLTWCREWAEVIFAKGSERREAAQQNATAPATFRVLSNSSTRAILATDRISFDGGLWDIKSVVPLGLNEGVEITAVRQVQ